MCIPFNFSDDQRQKYMPRGLVAEFVGGVQDDDVGDKIEKGCYQLV